MDLQNTLKVHCAFQDVQFEGKRLQRVSELLVNNVKYALHDVFVIAQVQAEEIPLFLEGEIHNQCRYMLGVMWKDFDSTVF